ncbi:MAG: hypothetical protein R2751_19255 [Bacteroidales bacterium]
MKRTGLLLPAALACAGTAFGQCAEPASITAISGKTYELVAGNENLGRCRRLPRNRAAT